METARKKVVTIHEAKTHLSRFVARAAAGEEFIIARGDRPMARLSPLSLSKKERLPGTARGEIVLSPDFFSPLPEDDIEAPDSRDGAKDSDGQNAQAGLTALIQEAQLQ